MSSLQDQLLKAGLVDAKKAKQADKEKRKKQKVAKKTGHSESDEQKKLLQEERAAKAEKDKALNKARQEALEQKAIAAQIKQLIERHQQDPEVNDRAIEYNFKDGKLVKKLRVSEAVHKLVTSGSLCIVKAESGYKLIPKIVADRIAERDASYVIVANTMVSSDQDDEDPYKDYVIPDDLMW